MLGSLDPQELVDLAVNAVPLLILLVFAVVFLLLNPWGTLDLATLLQFALLALPGLGLAYLTYRGGRLIMRDERQGPSRPGSEATPEAADYGDSADRG